MTAPVLTVRVKYDIGKVEKLHFIRAFIEKMRETFSLFRAFSVTDLPISRI